MSQILKVGQKVQTTSSQLECEIQKLLGDGGQGEVYQAKLGDNEVALKWYHPHIATAEQRTNLEKLVAKGSPSGRFLWPFDVAISANVEGFGYIMGLRPSQYCDIVSLMKRRVKPDPSFRVLAKVGFNLADSFYQLHAQGLCYRDINFGNVFFDPSSGDVLVCDNDNVGIDGASVGGVKGTLGFMAPEIVRDEMLPNTQTDLFSLSVLLFYIFMLHHPLDGKREADTHCLDYEAKKKLYGTDPLFIFDPQNRSNAPVPGYQDTVLAYWPLYPQFLRDLFIKAFSDGIRDPQQGRVRESEWRNAMLKLSDSIIYCGNCGVENFYDVEAIKSSGGKPPLCWACHRILQLPIRLRIGNNIIMLNYDSQIYPHHINSRNGLFDFSQPVAKVNRNPNDPNIWGLKNLSSEKWVVTTPSGIKDVEPGRSVTLAGGIKINFGSCEGEIRE